MLPDPSNCNRQSLTLLFKPVAGVVYKSQFNMFPVCKENALVLYSEVPGLKIENVFDSNTSFQESVYRCIQESLTNINKHSRPSHVSVTIEETKSTLSIWIKNNGILKNKSFTQGVGLLGMLERISSIKGTLNFFQRADSFNLKIQIPIR